MFIMAEVFTISEISRIVALPTHTIRYYEKQFPSLLNVSRSKGGHRMYGQKHIAVLKEIIRLLKEEKLSIKKTKQILGEEEEVSLQCDIQVDKADVNQLTAIMMNVLERLQSISESNARQQIILEMLLKKASLQSEDELIEQLGKCKLVKSYVGLLNKDIIGII